MSQVFMSDTDGFGMVIYNASTSKFCRIESNSMRATGLGYSVGNQVSPLQDSIFSMTVVQNKGTLLTRKWLFQSLGLFSHDERYFLSNLNYVYLHNMT
jgi:hypothetical protein